MNVQDLTSLASNFGQMGLFVGYLIWRELRDDRLKKERIEADLRVATALTLLEAAIKGRLG